MQTEKATHKFITAKEFMDVYCVPRSSFYRLVRAGELKIYKIGRASRLNADEAHAWAMGLPVADLQRV
jgi:excisionase family DNA binding protein